MRLEEFDSFLDKNDLNFTVGDSKQHNVLVFAFVGDAVFTLFIRSYFAVKNTYKAGMLHTLTSKVVNAGYQSKLYDAIYADLTEEEKMIAGTARNVHTHNIAKNSNLEEYKKATSFEAVLGYLYLTKKTDRLKQLLNQCLVLEKKDEN